MSAPKFSIIIPVYNVAPYLRKCLDSVIGQAFTDWEAICVDDGSTDESGRIINGYAQKDQRIKVIHQKNAGLSAARNSGMEAATGEWVCFLDGDDTLSSNWLSSYLRGTATDVDVIYGGVEQNGARRVGFDFDLVNCKLSGELIEKYNLLQHYFAYSRVCPCDLFILESQT